MFKSDAFWDMQAELQTEELNFMTELMKKKKNWLLQFFDIQGRL